MIQVVFSAAFCSFLGEIPRQLRRIYIQKIFSRRTQWKKEAALAVVAAMSLGMVISASAATLDEQGESKEVTISYSAGDTETVYSVDITWDSMAFTYYADDKKTWDPETHTWTVDGTGGTWTNENGDKTSYITVTNHSNAKIKATVTFSATSDALNILGNTAGFSLTNSSGIFNNKTYDGIVAESLTHDMTLADASVAAENDVENAPSDSIGFSFGTLTSPDTFEPVTLGTIKVTLEDVSE